MDQAGAARPAIGGMIMASAAELEYLRRELKALGKSSREIGLLMGRHHSNIVKFLSGQQDFPDETVACVYKSGLSARPTPDDLAHIETELAEQERKERQRIEYRPLSALQPHPLNASIYGDGCDQELLDSVKAKGILTPLLVTKNDQIISGHRRYNAAQMAGLTEVPVVIVETHDPLEIEELLIMTNRQRNKTPEMIAREYEQLLKIEAIRGKKRMSEGGKGQVNSPDLANNRGKQARDIVAQKLGVGGQKAERAAKVVKKIDELRHTGKGEEAEELRTTLNKQSVNAAYQKIAPRKNKPIQGDDHEQDTRVEIARLRSLLCEREQEIDILKRKNRQYAEEIAMLRKENAGLRKEAAKLHGKEDTTGILPSHEDVPTNQAEDVPNEIYFSLMCAGARIRTWRISPNQVDGKFHALNLNGNGQKKARLSIPDHLKALMRIDPIREEIEIPQELVELLEAQA